jgi:hypothetical protein
MASGKSLEADFHPVAVFSTGLSPFAFILIVPAGTGLPFLVGPFIAPHSIIVREVKSAFRDREK